MSTKSYTLADGTTATVNATDNGVPFNEGMSVLSKAIKAKINTSVGTSTATKEQPTLSLGGWSASDTVYSAVISYTGDGALSTSTGTITGSTITVADADGNFNGVISAAEGTNFAPGQLVFSYTTQTVSGGTDTQMGSYTAQDLQDAQNNASASSYNLMSAYNTDELGHDTVDLTNIKASLLQSSVITTNFQVIAATFAPIAEEQNGIPIYSASIEISAFSESDGVIIPLKMADVFLTYMKANNVIPKAMYACCDGHIYAGGDYIYLGVIVGNEFQILTASNLASASELYACCMWQDILDNDLVAGGGSADVCTLVGVV